MAYSPVPRYQLLGQLLGANMNTTADQAIALKSADCVVDKIEVRNASVSLTLAAGGFYTAASKGGTAIVAAGQLYSGLTSATLVLLATIAALVKISGGTLYFSLTTAQGGAATADIFVWGFNHDSSQP